MTKLQLLSVLTEDENIFFNFLRVIKSLAKWNGKEVPVSMLTNLLNKHQNDDEQEKSKEKSMTVLDLFKTKKLRIKTCILSCKYS